MVPEARNFGLKPVDVMITVNETAVKKGLVPQPHQFNALGKAMIEEAKNRDLDPQGFSLSDGQRLDIWVVEGGDMGISTVKDRQKTGFVAITVDDDTRGGQKFSTLGGSSYNQLQLSRSMIAACEEVLQIDLTPKPLYTSPKDRGVKSSE